MDMVTSPAPNSEGSALELTATNLRFNEIRPLLYSELVTANDGSEEILPSVTIDDLLRMAKRGGSIRFSLGRRNGTVVSISIQRTSRRRYTLGVSNLPQPTEG
jgi:hypothetical protein